LSDSDIRARLAAVRERISLAADRARRDPASILLVAVSKTFPADDVRAAADAGQRDFGENKVQEGLAKMEALRDLRLSWHLIGHLQSNKAKKAAQHFSIIQSVDSLALLRKINEAAGEANRRTDVLIQLDLAGEATKFGLPLPDARALVDAAIACNAVQLRGLMIIPPATADPNDARPYFSALRRIRDELVAGGVSQHHLRDLSMGMSHDFEVAIEEGATIIRVGSAIFGERAYV
jgi:pyridoxal phosphate enzyme (YggS family)